MPSSAVTSTPTAFAPAARRVVRVVPAVLPSASVITTSAAASLGVAVTVVSSTSWSTSAA